MTDYAEQLLARHEARKAFARVESIVGSLTERNQSARNAFHNWEAGFNAQAKGFKLCSLKSPIAKKGWRAASKIDRMIRSGKFDSVALVGLVERITLWKS